MFKLHEAASYDEIREVYAEINLLRSSTGLKPLSFDEFERITASRLYDDDKIFIMLTT